MDHRIQVLYVFEYAGHHAFGVTANSTGNRFFRAQPIDRFRVEIPAEVVYVEALHGQDADLASYRSAAPTIRATLDSHIAGSPLVVLTGGYTIDLLLVGRSLAYGVRVGQGQGLHAGVDTPNQAGQHPRRAKLYEPIHAGIQHETY